jgi:hypothetical protein
MRLHASPDFDPVANLVAFVAGWQKRRPSGIGGSPVGLTGDPLVTHREARRVFKVGPISISEQTMGQGAVTKFQAHNPVMSVIASGLKTRFREIWQKRNASGCPTNDFLGSHRHFLSPEFALIFGNPSFSTATRFINSYACHGAKIAPQGIEFRGCR